MEDYLELLLDEFSTEDGEDYMIISSDKENGPVQFDVDKFVNDLNWGFRNSEIELKASATTEDSFDIISEKKDFTYRVYFSDVKLYAGSEAIVDYMNDRYEPSDDVEVYTYKINIKNIDTNKTDEVENINDIIEIIYNDFRDDLNIDLLKEALGEIEIICNNCDSVNRIKKGAKFCCPECGSRDIDIIEDDEDKKNFSDLLDIDFGD